MSMNLIIGHKHKSWEFKMAVFREKKRYSKLTRIIGGVGDNSLTQLAGILYGGEIIDQHQKNDAIRNGLLKGAGQLIDHVIEYAERVEGRDRRIQTVLDLMYECEWLRDIVREMREDYQPVPSIPNFNPQLGQEDTDGSHYIVFLSFKWGEGDKLVKYLHQCLKNKGLNPWKDDKEMVPGDNLPGTIATAVEGCSLFVYLLSPGYFGSKWCKKEFDIANKKGKKIVPIQWDEGVKYPEEYAEKYKDILYHKYNPNPVHEAAENATCASNIMKFINKKNAGTNEE